MNERTARHRMQDLTQWATHAAAHAAGQNQCREFSHFRIMPDRFGDWGAAPADLARWLRLPCASGAHVLKYVPLRFSGQALPASELRGRSCCGRLFAGVCVLVLRSRTEVRSAPVLGTSLA